MQATRYGFYYNNTTTSIPAGNTVIMPKQKIHSTDPNFALITQKYESYLTPEYAVPYHERPVYNTVGTIISKAIDAALSPLPDDLEAKLKPITEGIKESASELLGDFVNDILPDNLKDKEPVVETPVEPVVEEHVVETPVEEPKEVKEKPKKSKAKNKDKSEE